MRQHHRCTRDSTTGVLRNMQACYWLWTAERRRTNYRVCKRTYGLRRLTLPTSIFFGSISIHFYYFCRVWLFAPCKAMLSSTRTVSTRPRVFFTTIVKIEASFRRTFFELLTLSWVSSLSPVCIIFRIIFCFVPRGIFVYCECCVWRDVKLHNGGLSSAVCVADASACACAWLLKFNRLRGVPPLSGSKRFANSGFLASSGLTKCNISGGTELSGHGFGAYSARRVGNGKQCRVTPAFGFFSFRYFGSCQSNGLLYDNENNPRLRVFTSDGPLHKTCQVETENPIEPESSRSFTDCDFGAIRKFGLGRGYWTLRDADDY